jgi:hypothetical protein
MELDQVVITQVNWTSGFGTKLVPFAGLPAPKKRGQHEVKK